MIVAGIGARAAAAAEDIVNAVREACGRAGLEPSEVGIVAGLTRAQTDAAVMSAAKVLAARPVLFTNGQLQAEAARCVTHSDRSLAATGLPSVAEAAAMAGAGPDGLLFAPRIAFANVTVALAIGPGGAGE